MADETSVEYLDEWDVPSDAEVTAYLSSTGILGLLALPQDPEERRQAWLALHEIADTEK